MSVKVANMGRVRTALQQVVQEMAGKAVRQSVRAAGKVIQAEIEANAPVLDARTAGSTSLEPGALRGDIHTTVVENDGVITAIVGPGKRTKHVARWLEDGHRLVKNGRQVGTVQRHPFIEAAAESSRSAANEAFAAEQKAQLERLR